jgi:hypothetical protein
MKLPAPVQEAFENQLSAPLAELVEAYQLSKPQTAEHDASPLLLAEAFARLFEAMRQTDASLAKDGAGPEGNHARADAVSELGEYALELFDQATNWSKNLDLSEVFLTLQTFTVNIARWIARRGGHLLKLEPVVDALAQIANRTQDPGELLELYQAMGEIMDATAPAIRRDLEKTNPGRPWRILQLNRAIVATRTHQPDVMEEAFAAFAEHMPEDAPRFFSEGMQQMELLNYPPHVRDVMDRYYRKWSASRSLH